MPSVASHYVAFGAQAPGALSTPVQAALVGLNRRAPPAATVREPVERR